MTFPTLKNRVILVKYMKHYGKGNHAFYIQHEDTEIVKTSNEELTTSLPLKFPLVNENTLFTENHYL